MGKKADQELSSSVLLGLMRWKWIKAIVGWKTGITASYCVCSFGTPAVSNERFGSLTFLAVSWAKE